MSSIVNELLPSNGISTTYFPGDKLQANCTNDIYNHDKANECPMCVKLLQLLNGVEICMSESWHHLKDTKFVCDGTQCHIICSLLMFIIHNDFRASENIICPTAMSDGDDFIAKICVLDRSPMNDYDVPLCYKVTHNTQIVYICVVE